MVRSKGKRLVRALVLGLLCFLALGGGVGFALADDGAQDSLAVPAPRPGDRVSYHVTKTLLPDLKLGGQGDIMLDEVVYEWLPERVVLDRDFAPHLSQPLQATYIFRWGSNESRFNKIADYDPWTGAPFHIINGGQYTTQEVVLGYLDGNLGRGLDTVVKPAVAVDYLGESYDWFMAPPCAQRTALHGAPADVIPAKLDLGACGWPADRIPTFVPGGWDRLDTVGRAYRLDSPGSPLLHAWYQTGSPFPVRLATAMAEGVDPSWTVGRLFTLERTAWARGSTEYPVHEAPTGPAAPGAGSVALAPLRAGQMLDDEGMGGELPLSRAYAAAERAPRTNARTGAFGALGMGRSQPSVREWLAAHPDAYLAEASRWESVDWYGQVDPFWSLLWVDGDSWLGKMVSWEPTQEDAFATYLPDATGRRLVVIDWWPTMDDERLASYPARPGQDTLPFAPEVAARFLESSPASRVNNYGFRFTCRADCSIVGSYVWAGQTQTTVDSKGSATGGSVISDSLVVDQDGLALQRFHQTREPQPAFGLGAPSKDDTPPPTEASIGAAGHWAMPSDPAAATGISLVALAVSALYYFWPNLKGLVGAGLFSRIDDGAVLDHPTRRRIHDAITSEPGIHFQALARKTDVGRGALDHHLRKLVDADLVIVRRAPGYTCYFVKGTVDRHMADAAPTLRSEGSRAVLQAVRAQPGRSSRDLAAALGLAPSTVSYHLKRLEEAGLVFGVGAGAGARLSPRGEQAAAAA